MILKNQTISMDLHHRGITPVIDAVQGDDGSRTLELALTQSGVPAAVPENPAVLIRYKKADGTGGEYDTLEDGSPAWSAEENRLVLRLAAQMMTFPGAVDVTVSLSAGGALVSTFPIQLDVAPCAKAPAADSQDYFHISGFLAAPGNARKGQYLQVAEVDSSGRVTGIQAADAANAGMGGADWNAAPGQPGHIKNRPFYAETSYDTILKEYKPIYDENDGLFYILESFSLTEGAEYTVRWNGTPWVCTAMEVPLSDEVAVVGLGDMGALEGVPITGEPFGLICVPPELSSAFGGICGMIQPMDGTTDLTIAIEGFTETVHPIDPKFLGAMKGQKRFILNLDSFSASCAPPAPEDVDTAGLQAGIIVIYQGKEHSATVNRRDAYDMGAGITMHNVVFSFLHTSEGGGTTEVITCSWNGTAINGSVRKQVLTEPFTSPSDALRLYVIDEYSMIPSWHKSTDVLLDGIWMKGPNGKKYLFTADENGCLISEEKPF